MKNKFVHTIFVAILIVIVACFFYNHYLPSYQYWQDRVLDPQHLLYLSSTQQFEYGEMLPPSQVRLQTADPLNPVPLNIDRNAIVIGEINIPGPDYLQIRLQSLAKALLIVDAKVIPLPGDGSLYRHRLTSGSHIFVINCSNIETEKEKDCLHIALEKYPPWHLQLPRSTYHMLFVYFGIVPPICLRMLLIDIVVFVVLMVLCYRWCLRSLPPWLLLLLTTSCLLRTIFVMGLHQPIDYVHSDMAGYWQRAFELCNGLPDHPYNSVYPPGTQWLYSVIIWVLGIERYYFLEFTLVLLSTAITYLIAKISVTLLNLRFAIWAGWLSVWHYPFISFSGFFMAELPLIFLFLLGTLWWIRYHVHANYGYGIASIVAFSCAAYFKTIAIPIIIQIVLFSLWRRQWKIALLFCVVSTSLLAPSAIRNFYLTGEYHLVSSNGGLNFLEGNSDYIGVRLISPHGVYCFQTPLFGYTRHNQPLLTVKHAPWDSQQLMQIAWQLNAKTPQRALERCVGKMLDLFSIYPPWPESHTEFAIINKIYHLFFLFALLPVAAIGCIILARQCSYCHWRRYLALILLIPIFNALVIAFAFYGTARYRLPIDPFLLILSAIGLGSLFAQKNNRS